MRRPREPNDSPRPEYEGDIPNPWGNISAQELVHRFWITVLRGGYAGHGETFMHRDDELWWAKGGVLRGESYARIGFLFDLLREDVSNGLTPMTAKNSWVWHRMSAARDGDVRFIYFGEHQPLEWAVGLPEDNGDYDIDLIDTWNMTISPLDKAPLPKTHPQRVGGGEIISAKPDAAFGVRLPGKPFQALRVRPRR